MNELTLESLAARVEALEKLLDIPPGAVLLKNGLYALPPTVDRETALAALDTVEEFDFEAVRKAGELELQIAREQLEEWERGQPQGNSRDPCHKPSCPACGCS